MSWEVGRRRWRRGPTCRQTHGAVGARPRPRRPSPVRWTPSRSATSSPRGGLRPRRAPSARWCLSARMGVRDLRPAELAIGKFSRIEGLRLADLVSAAAAQAARPVREGDWESVVSEDSSGEEDVAVAGGGCIGPRPPELEVAMAEEALALTAAGADDAEPGAAARVGRSMRGLSCTALVMHRTRCTVHRADCKFARRMGRGARVALTAPPVANWQRCRFCRTE